MELTTAITSVVTGHGLVGAIDVLPDRWVPPLSYEGRRAVLLRREGLGAEEFAPNITVELRPVEPSVDPADVPLPTSRTIVRSSAAESPDGIRLAVTLWPRGTVIHLERWIAPNGPAGPSLWVVCSALDSQWASVAADFDHVVASAALFVAPRGVTS